MPEQFKDSAFGRIPKGWEIKSLAVLASEITSGATPTSGSARYYCDAGGLPFAKIDDLTASSTRFLERTSLQVTRAALRETALVEYPAGTLLLSMYGTIGLVKTTARPMCANQALAAIIPPFSCDPSFLAHVLEWSRPKWDRFKAQTTQANINGRIVKDFLLAVPPEEEQRRIADILDTVDDAIRQTERVIAKLEQVKSGMLQDLLTRGIDDNGEVRDPDRHPEQFKDSPLGRIPKGWAQRRISEMIELLDHLRIPVNGDERAERPGSVPYYGANGQQGWIDRPIFDEPLILLAEDGGNFEDFATRPIAYRISGPAWVNNHAHIIRAAQGTDQGFLFWALVHKDIRRYIAGGTRSKLTQGELLSIELASPGLIEQRRIAERLDQHEGQVRREYEALAKLRATKQAIADDLLTGRVRVNTRERVPA